MAQNPSKTRRTQLAVTGLLPRAIYTYRLLRHAFPFGTALNFERMLDGDKTPAVQQYVDAYVRTFDEYFNAAVAEQTFKWHIVESGGTPDWSPADRAMTFVRERPWLRDRFRGHTVFWNRHLKLPAHLQNTSRRSVLDALFAHRLQMLTRFADIAEWDLLNEPLARDPALVNGADTNALIWSPDDDIEVFVELFRRAHALRPDARLLVNEYSILNGGKTSEYMRFIDRLLTAGAPISGIGVQGHIRPKPFFAPPEVAAENLRQLATLGLPITVTEFDCSDRVFDGNTAERATYTREMLDLFFGASAVAGVYIWGYQDKTHWRGAEGAGLFSDTFALNVVGAAYFDAIRTKWSTAGRRRADARGQMTFHGYPGEYEFTGARGTTVVTLQ